MAWSTAVLREQCAEQAIAAEAAAAAPAVCTSPEFDEVVPGAPRERQARWQLVGVGLLLAAVVAAVIAVAAVLGDGPSSGGGDGSSPLRVRGPRAGTRAVALAEAMATDPPAVRIRRGRWLVRTAGELVLVEQQETWNVKGPAQHLVVCWRCPVAELTDVTGRVELHFADGSSVRMRPGWWRSRGLRRVLVRG